MAERKQQKTTKARSTRKPRAPRKRASAKPLPAPEALPAPSTPTVAEPQPQKSEPESGGLFGLGNLFNTAQPENLPADLPVSLPGSTANYEGNLTEEAARLLATVPGTVTDESETPAPGASARPESDDPIAALMAQVAFEPQDVQDLLGEFFDYLAEKFDSDHWRLTERQARMLGRPAAQLANTMWARLQSLLPDIVGRWCETTPGATAFITACGLVVAPKVMRQVKLSRERKGQLKHRAVDVQGTQERAEMPRHVQPAPAAQRGHSGVMWA